MHGERGDVRGSTMPTLGLLALQVVLATFPVASAVLAAPPAKAPAEARLSVAGTVRDSNGQPVKEAVVVAAITDRVRGRPVAIGRQVTRTDAEGRYRITVVGDSPDTSRSRLTVCAYGEPFCPSHLVRNLSGPEPKPEGVVLVDDAREVLKSDKVDRVGPTPLTGDVDLVLEPAVPFVGQVRDQAGQPVEGAWIRFEGILREAADGTLSEVFPPSSEFVRDSPLEVLYRVKSDRTGTFRFPALPSGSHLLLKVEAKGMADLRTRRIYGAPADPLAGYLSGTADRPAEIVLGPEARVIGRVITALPGVKTSGLTLLAQNTDDSKNIVYWKPVKTDVEGRFVIDGLDESTINLFLVDHPPAGEWTYRAIANANLTPGEATEVQIELIRAVLAEGTVVDLEGKPVAKAHVGLYGPMRPRSGGAIIGDTTDAAGRYRFRVPPGETYFYIVGPPKGYVRLPGENSSQLVEIPEDAAEVDVPPIPLQSVGP